ncbi:hypothetical protein GIB67_020386 [Kingdonia uniflora]|uniref:SMP domain-containing protein n=1 Tax=Kingdonia uniflora TaxID=39325 RepID=A0A7J7LBJ2_9MAGN|nr:hypothetical protein GIB67_020386 [Kingdonia uniflora]
MSQEQPRRLQEESIKYGDVFPEFGDLASKPIFPQDAAMMQTAENLVLGQTQKGGAVAVMQWAATCNESAGVGHTDIAGEQGVSVIETDVPDQRIVTESVAGQMNIVESYSIVLTVLCLFLCFCLDRGSCQISIVDDSGNSLHSHSLRAICFGANGSLFASAGDDKLVKIWSADTWKCIRTVWWKLIHCFGMYISCLVFICTLEYPKGFLLSGSGDSTVRLWDFTSGSLLSTCEVGVQAGLVESNGKEEVLCPAVTDICASLDGSVVAVAIQRQIFNALILSEKSA